MENTNKNCKQTPHTFLNNFCWLHDLSAADVGRTTSIEMNCAFFVPAENNDEGVGQHKHTHTDKSNRIKNEQIHKRSKLPQF